MRQDTNINRRDWLCIAAAGLAGATARAAPATLSRPLFLHGPVAVLTWADPYPQLELLHRAAARRQLAAFESMAAAGRFHPDVRRLLARAIVPPVVDGGRWVARLPSLARLQVADLPRPHIGDVVSLLGAWRSPVTGTPAVEALVLLRNGRAWLLPPTGSEPEN